MKAIVYRKYGSPEVLKLEEVEKPTPGDEEILVRVNAASINYGDWGLLRGKPIFLRFMNGGFLAPKHNILGGDVSGRVEAIRGNGNLFQPGDEVFADLSDCGRGGFAEFVCAPEDRFVQKPANLSHQEAAAVPMAAVTALQGIRNKGQIQPGAKVLINGASGGVGSFAVQIAKSFGAEVTAVCSTQNLEIARSNGADYVIDYTVEDFTRGEKRYDLIIAANGYHPISDYDRVLSSKGVYVCTGGSLTQIFQSMVYGPRMSSPGGKQFGNLSQTQSRDDLIFLKQLLETRKVIPVIDRCYSLSEVPEAFRYFGQGHTRGKVVITVE
ncbi:MAG: NAD(P)-dependent alcohol dehydrogenase [Chloroflexota bacterium]|nr:MAG: NAD(P)-dependent alcohol dehydrogenase [Chloroflexota bacterium]